MSNNPIPLKNIHDLVGKEHIPQNWMPSEFVIADLTYEYLSEGTLNFNFDPIKYYSGDDLEKFIAAIPNGLPAPNPPPASKETIHPLEIVVREYCWVLIRLDPNRKMRFRSKGAAITAKENYGINNCGLIHFERDFTRLQNPPGERCFAAAFAVVSRNNLDGVDHNFINLHIELEQGSGRGWLEIALDPDVPDDGGTPPPAADYGVTPTRAQFGPSVRGGHLREALAARRDDAGSPKA